MAIWYQTLIHAVHGAQYMVGDTIVYVSGRPDYERTGSSVQVDLSAVEGWLSVTDRFVPHPPKALHSWIQWRESGPPKPEVIHGVLKTLNYWIDELKLKSVYIHCDAGTHRSPTVFGAYLDTYHPLEAQNIVDNKILLGKIESHHSCPLLYWKSYLGTNPELKLLADAVKQGPVSEWGHESLDETISNNKLPWHQSLIKD